MKDGESKIGHQASGIMNQNPNAFTLVEILIAMFIFAVVLSTIYTSYTGTFRIVNETESQADIYRMARIALERMFEDLESVYTPEKEEQTNQPFQFVGENRKIKGREADTLCFISRAHVAFGEHEQTSGIAEVSYYVEEDDDGDGFVLYRTDRPMFEQAPEKGTGGLVLCDSLISVNFTYHDAKGQVHDKWDSTAGAFKERIPKIVSISLEFANKSDPESPFKFMTSVALPMGRG